MGEGEVIIAYFLSLVLSLSTAFNVVVLPRIRVYELTWE